MLAYIQDNAEGFLEGHELPEGQNLSARPTYNIVKVMRMLELIESYKQEVKRLKEALKRVRAESARVRAESARIDEALGRTRAENLRLKKKLGELRDRPDEET